MTDIAGTARATSGNADWQAQAAANDPAAADRARPLTPVEEGEQRAARDAAAADGSEEGVGAFFEGAIKGDLGDNRSWSATAGQVLTGFIPVVGQIADVRDTGAAIGQVLRGEEGGWLSLGAAAVGFVPGIGDAAKGAIRGGGRLADAGGEVVTQAARRSDEAATVARREIVMDGGRKGDWPPELNARTLEADADYVVNGYRYATDGQGRVTSVEGRLDLQTAERNGYQQAVSGREDRLPDDQGGHLIASIFNGPGDRLNLVPMNGNFNMGAWRSMEAEFADAMKAGADVDVRIDVVYAADGARPAKFVVDATVDGVASTRVFRNQAGG